MPKNLDPSYKMALDLCDCLGRFKLVFYQNVIGLIESFVGILEREKTLSCSRISTAISNKDNSDNFSYFSTKIYVIL